jgi:ribosomal protein S27E
MAVETDPYLVVWRRYRRTRLTVLVVSLGWPIVCGPVRWLGDALLGRAAGWFLVCGYYVAVGVFGHALSIIKCPLCDKRLCRYGVNPFLARCLNCGTEIGARESDVERAERLRRQRSSRI